MTTARMQAAFLARDGRWDGRFVAGVTTTGVYCVASCKARKPRPEHLRLFADPAAARAAGFRACRRCRPDDVVAGRDPDVDRIEAVLAALRAAPAECPDVATVARRFALGATRLEALFRAHRHESVARELRRARVRAACALLATTSRKLLAIGEDVGWSSASALHAAFREFANLGPDAYRRALHDTRFELVLPAEFLVADALDWLGRDPASQVARRVDRRVAQALRLAGRPAALTIDLERRGLAICEVVAAPRVGPTGMAQAIDVARGLLGLDADVSGFARRLARLGPAHAWAAARPGLRPQRHAEPFVAVLTAIAHQQVHREFGSALQRALVDAAGEPAPLGLRCPPTAGAVAALDGDALRGLRFSRAKADALLGVAARVAAGELDLAALAEGSARRAAAALSASRGVGPWTTGYVLMRGFGFQDCVPAGDVALADALRQKLGLRERPDLAGLAAGLAPFAPFRSQACLQLANCVP